MQRSSPAQASRLAPSRRRAGMTLIEVLVVLAIIAFLIAFMAPVVHTLRSRSQQAACTNNLRQIGAAWGLFASENNGILGYYDKTGMRYWGGKKTPNWGDVQTKDRPLYPYLSDPKVFCCPGDRGRYANGSEASFFNVAGNSYCMANSTERGILALSPSNTFTAGRTVPGRLQGIEKPSKTILVFDSTLLNKISGWNRYWHSLDTSNVLMVDGHVEVFTREQAEKCQTSTNPAGYSWGWAGWEPHSQW